MLPLDTHHTDQRGKDATFPMASLGVSLSMPSSAQGLRPTCRNFQESWPSPLPCMFMKGQQEWGDLSEMKHTVAPFEPVRNGFGMKAGLQKSFVWQLWGEKQIPC